jgi:hypothetical protein
LLGALIKEGQDLFSSAGRADPSDFKRRLELWATVSNAFITDSFGEAESALFLNSSEYDFDARRISHPQNQKAAAFIEWRLRRLSDLIQRMPALPINEDFNPVQWERPIAELAAHQFNRGIAT